MGIAIREFEIAMELLGATKLHDKEIRYNSFVPCYKVCNVILVHSGSNYIVQQGNRVPTQIMERAKFELSKKNNNFIFRNEIHSVQGLITISLMLQNRYTKEYSNMLINETYREIFKNPLFWNYISHPFHGIELYGSNKLYKLLEEYDRLVNPFVHSNGYVKLKDPSKYLNDFTFEFNFNSEIYSEPNVSLTLLGSNSSTEFISSENRLIYYSEYLNNETGFTYDGYTSLEHSYYRDGNKKNTDELIIINAHNIHEPSSTLKVSLKTGLTWNTGKKDAAPLTVSQLGFITENLGNCVSRIRRTIISKLID